MLSSPVNLIIATACFMGINQSLGGCLPLFLFPTRAIAQYLKLVV